MTTTTPRLDQLEQNLIINGNMDFWQRGTSFAAISDNSYSTDRFKYRRAGTHVETISRSTDVPTQVQSGFNSLYSLLHTTTTAQSSLGASDFSIIRYIMEGQDYQRLHAKKCRLQFWVKVTGTNVTGTYSLAFFNAVGNRFYVTTYSVPSAGVWQKISVDVPLDTTGTWGFDNTFGLAIDWIMAIGTNFQTSSLNTWTSSAVEASTAQVNNVNTNGNTFQLAQVMLIPQDYTQAGTSTVDVPFQRTGRTIGDELRMCQRYCYRPGFDGSQGANWTAAIGYNQSTTSPLYIFHAPTAMRVVPTLTRSGMTVIGPTNNNIAISSASVQASFSTTQIFTLVVTVASGLTQGGCTYLQATSGTDLLLFDAEL